MLLETVVRSPCITDAQLARWVRKPTTNSWATRAIAFLWSGAPLPAGVSLANYAHCGAYPLIVAAMLASVFVFGTIKLASATAASPEIRTG